MRLFNKTGNQAASYGLQEGDRDILRLAVGLPTAMGENGISDEWLKFTYDLPGRLVKGTTPEGALV